MTPGRRLVLRAADLQPVARASVPRAAQPADRAAALNPAAERRPRVVHVPPPVPLVTERGHRTTRQNEVLPRALVDPRRIDPRMSFLRDSESAAVHRSHTARRISGVEGLRPAALRTSASINLTGDRMTKAHDPESRKRYGQNARPGCHARLWLVLERRGKRCCDFARASVPG